MFPLHSFPSFPPFFLFLFSFPPVIYSVYTFNIHSLSYRSYLVPRADEQEQQTVSIAKAGIITTLNARTSILAAANPINSRYDPKLPIPANIDLPPTLISRFDLLYLVLDKVDEMSDRRLAKHLVSLYLEDRPDTAGHDIIVCLPSLQDRVTDELLTCLASRDPDSLHHLRPREDPPRPHRTSIKRVNFSIRRNAQGRYRL